MFRPNRHGRWARRLICRSMPFHFAAEWGWIGLVEHRCKIAVAQPLPARFNGYAYNVFWFYGVSSMRSPASDAIFGDNFDLFR